MESFVRRCLVSLLSVALAAAPAAAQSSRFVALGFGGARLESPAPEFLLPLSGMPTIALGVVSARGHGLELRASRVETEASVVYVYPTRCCVGNDTPYTIGVRASAFELGYFHQAWLVDGRLRTRVGLDATTARVVDRWRSDTPTEKSRAWLFGAGASLGLGAPIVGGTSLVARGAYQHYDDGAGRPGRHVGLSGFRFEAGLELGF